MKINSTIFFTIASLMYSVLLMIAYFSKDKIKTPENKVYSKMGCNFWYLCISNIIKKGF